MTIPKFGRVTPAQMFMLFLVGYGFSGSDATLEMPPDQKMNTMLLGLKELKAMTGNDFGFDLSEWRSFLLSNEEYGYTHPYAFSGVDEAVLSSLLDKERKEIIAEGHRFLENFLASLIFPLDALIKALPRTSGVYRIFESETSLQTNVYVGESKNMLSHATGKHTKALFERKYKTNILSPKIDNSKTTPKSNLQFQFITLDDIDRMWFANFAIYILKPIFNR